MKIKTTFYVLIVLSILSILNPLTSFAQTNYMYWVDWRANKIQRANLDGSNVQDIVIGFGRPVDVTLDIVGGKIYWTDRDRFDHTDPAGRSSINRANLDGTNIETLILDGSSVKEYIVLDISNGKVYWTEWTHVDTSNTGKIRRANLDGSNVEDLVTGLTWELRGIALDVFQGKMYWGDNGTDKIQCANLDGSNVQDILTTDGARDIALDVVVGKIYWANQIAGKIQHANLNGSNVEDLVGGLQAPFGIALDIAGGKVYWTDVGSAKIQRANLDGTNIEDLITTGLNTPIGIALGIPQPDSGLRFSPSTIADQTFTVGTSVNVTLPVATGGTAPYTYSISALPAGLYFDAATQQIYGTPTTVVSAHPVTYTVRDANGSTASLDFTITVQSTPSVTDIYMYWADAHKIRRANLDGTNIQDLVTIGNMGEVYADNLALDVIAGKMYWGEHATRKIRRANLDGSNVEDLLTGVNGPEGIALDVAARKIYWVEQFGDRIQRANLDGTNIQGVVTTGVSQPAGLALDVAGGKMYWTAIGKIQCANLDGTNIQDLVLVESGYPAVIALDVAEGKMYWTVLGAAKIQCANLDGTNVRDLVTGSDGLINPDGIALDVANRKMYWTDWGARKIQRANLDGTNIEDLITTGLSWPIGIALSIPQTPPDDGLRFSPSEIADQMFTVGTYASLNLPIATGGTEPYTYTLTPDLPAGLQFDAFDRWIGGTPTTPMPATPYTYTAMDTTGASASLTFMIEVTGTGTSNLDVNGDGQVTVIDLAIVALFYGTQVPVGVSLPADVNTDGVVDILDLTAVAQGIDAAGGGLNQLSLWEVEAALLAAAEQVAEIGAVAGAPMGFGTGQHALSNGIAYGNVAAALADARQMTVGDVRLGKGMAVLEGILQLLEEMGAIPETTALLPNYPNPFNPETWIPYHLATDAAVIVTIYDISGTMVRQLALGHQPAGVYQSRGRAAYWDGKNVYGERVASGLYFYSLTAGDFVATRKLLIAK